jgi:hypothetical protein
MADDGHGGRVPGKWKDNLPVIPDKVVDALEAGVDVPLEAMVSGPAMEMLEDKIAERRRPLHLENLIPVPKGDPRVAPPRLDGQSLPQVPQMRRVIPPPYQRPSATIRQDHGRSWQDLAAAQAKVDDIVAGIGKIISTWRVPDTSAGEVVVLLGMGAVCKAFTPDAPLKIFAEDKNDPVPGA